MAFKGIIDNRRIDAENFAAMQRSISNGLSEALNALSQIKALKGQQLMQENIRRAITKGPQPEWGGMEQEMATPADTLDARMARVNQAITGTRASARPKDFLSGLLSAFNPNVPTFLETTPIEDLVTRGAVGEMFRDPMDDEYRRAQIDSAKARAQQASGQPSQTARLNFASQRIKEGVWDSRQGQTYVVTGQWPEKETKTYTPIQPGSLPGKPLPPKEGEMWRAAPMKTSGFGAPGIETTPPVTPSVTVPPSGTALSSELPQIKTDEEYDALPSGTEFIDAQTGVKYRKP